eukprot:bmy_05781T0
MATPSNLDDVQLGNQNDPKYSKDIAGFGYEKVTKSSYSTISSSENLGKFLMMYKSREQGTVIPTLIQKKEEREKKMPSPKFPCPISTEEKRETKTAEPRTNWTQQNGTRYSGIGRVKRPEVKKTYSENVLCVTDIIHPLDAAFRKGRYLEAFRVVRHLTNRCRLSYNTASNKTRLPQTPGNTIVYLQTKKTLRNVLRVWGRCCRICVEDGCIFQEPTTTSRYGGFEHRETNRPPPSASVLQTVQKKSVEETAALEHKYNATIRDLAEKCKPKNSQKS